MSWQKLKWSAWLQLETLSLICHLKSFSFWVVNSTQCSRSVHWALAFCHIPSTPAASHVFSFLILFALSPMSSHLFLLCSSFGSTVNKKKRMAAGFCSPLCSIMITCPVEWHGTAGQLYYPPLICSGREHRLMLPSPLHWHLHTADSKELQVPLLCHDSITVATELINPASPVAFVRKDKTDTSWTDSAHKL